MKNSEIPAFLNSNSGTNLDDPGSDGPTPASLSDSDLENEIDVLEHDIMDIEIQIEDDTATDSRFQHPGNWRKRAQDARRFKKLRLRQLNKEFELRSGRRPRLIPAEHATDKE